MCANWLRCSTTPKMTIFTWVIRKPFEPKVVVFLDNVSPTVFELLKEGEVLVVPTDNPMSEKEVWLAFRDVVHGLEYRAYLNDTYRL